MKIIQIIPANAWRAVYSLEAPVQDEPLVCWALVDGEGKEFIGQEVKGMVVEETVLDFADSAENFIGYRRV